MNSLNVNTVRYRGMMFTDDSMRKIIALRKTQTRRLIRLPKWMREKGGTLEKAWADPGLGGGGYLKVPLSEDSSVQRLHCPFGVIGDRIWTKEAWASVDDNDSPRVLYRADPMFDGAHEGIVSWEWRSPFFMPRWASRATLEIVNVFPQPLNDISEVDAIAEGIQRENLPPDPDNFHPPGSYGYVSGMQPFPHGYIYPRAKEAFTELWQSINAKRSPWERNDWVWAITFALVEAKP